MEPLTVGQSDPLVALVKARLGVYPVDDVFTEELAQRIRGVQMTHGLTLDGLLDEPVLDVLEVQR